MSDKKKHEEQFTPMDMIVQLRESNSFFKKLSAFCVVVSIAALAYQKSNESITTILIPPNFSELDGPVKVEKTKNRYTSDAAYMSELALGDAGLALTYTPETVLNQTNRFLNRLTPELYSAKKAELLAQAEQLRRDGISQVFYPDETSVQGNKVIIKGTQTRFLASKEVQKNPVTYIVTYKDSKGYFHVSSFLPKQ